MEQWAEAGVGNCVNFGVFYAKEVPTLGRKNLGLHPLHSPISTFTPHFPLTASHPALTCSESQLHSNPRCSAGQSQGQGGTSTPGGSLDPAEPPRPQDYSSQTPAPARVISRIHLFPLPGKHRSQENTIVFLFGFHSLSVPG